MSIFQLYAYAKVAQGNDISAAKKPGMFDLAVRLHHPVSSPDELQTRPKQTCSDIECGN